ncbi:hypothetical protein [Rhodohalobacter sp. 614A]|uniref:hypothetical protein n=1 Tax=Rhodohalobacter sp. 614A TaxID=2908649 RepID=UPI001F38D5E3|nr:hypothetical protein [Rhodohalobacter sp. 614A]
MQTLIVEILSHPVHVYSLKADNIEVYQEKALEEARDLFLEFYDEVYQNLMMKDFNPLWTPDTKSENDVDFKDDFWRVSYFFYNVSLIKLLQKEHRVKVVDRTTSPFDIQAYFYNFLKQEGIEFEKVHKPDRFINRNAIKKFVLNSIRNFPQNILSFGKEIKKRLTLKKSSIQNTHPDKKKIYLFVEPVGDIKYIDWRYKELLQEHDEKRSEIIFVSTINFKGADEQKYKFINVNRLLSKPDLGRTILESFWAGLKVRMYKLSKRLKPGTSTEFKYFLKNVPTSFFYPVRENIGFNNLFEKFGRGLLVIKGPVLNKSGAMQIQNARKHGVHTSIVAARILTSTRLSNQFVPSHFNQSFPRIYPDSMVIYDRLSFETIQKQAGEKITLHTMGNETFSYDEVKPVRSEVFKITLALQKKKEIETMVDTVVEAIEGMGNVVLNLKMHPSFPIPEKLMKRYRQIPFINIMPVQTSLDDTIRESDVCITSYSTASLEFVKKGKPTVWLKNVTLNSLFFADLQKNVGICISDSGELKKLIKKMKDDPDYYSEESRKQHAQINQILYHLDETSSLSEVIQMELEKV